jgi:hypothetical protein
MIRILLADDRDVVLRGLRHLVEGNQVGRFAPKRRPAGKRLR